MPMETEDQIQRALTLVRDVLGDSLRGVYLHGSAVSGALGPSSDLDLLVVLDRPTTEQQRIDLIEGMRPISSRHHRPRGWRPLELTIVAAPDIDPWRFPPRTNFQSGEWLRAEFDSGVPQPWKEVNPDLAVVIAMVRQASRPLVGPEATELLPEVPDEDVRRAMTDGINALLADLETDTTNVLLTLARIWITLATSKYASKADAAAWAANRLPSQHAAVLTRAGAINRGHEADDWTGRQPAVQAAAAHVVEGIQSAS